MGYIKHINIYKIRNKGKFGFTDKEECTHTVFLPYSELSNGIKEALNGYEKFRVRNIVYYTLSSITTMNR